MLKKQKTTALVFKRLGFMSKIFLFMTAVLLMQAVPGYCTVIDDPTLEKELLAMFPRLFHTEEEIEELSFIEESFVTRHACCQSTTSWPSFKSAKDRHNRIVKLIRFNDRKQHVQQDTCKQADDCAECKCKLQDRYFKALVIHPHNPNNVYLEWVKAPLVCKCINGDSESTEEDMLGESKDEL